VVASRSGGIPEILRDRREALLFAPGDADACAKSLSAVFEQGEETTARTERAFARVSALSAKDFLREIDTFIADSLAALSG
jgi:glycosyltransferase involved in cell wall biosynthesis